jgi:muramoyltetrapeptide carboxypeptidase
MKFPEVLSSYPGVTSAPAVERARALTEMLTDPAIAAVVPPWDGELAVEILMDTPYQLPAELRRWWEIAALSAGQSVSQAAAPMNRSAAVGIYRWQDEPTVVTYSLDKPGGRWQLCGPVAEVDVNGRLIGGCIETVSMLAGTEYGDLPAFADGYAQDDGLIVYLEAAEDSALNIARHLWRDHQRDHQAASSNSSPEQEASVMLTTRRPDQPAWVGSFVRRSG